MFLKSSIKAFSLSLMENFVQCMLRPTYIVSSFKYVSDHCSFVLTLRMEDTEILLLNYIWYISETFWNMESKLYLITQSLSDKSINTSVIYLNTNPLKKWFCRSLINANWKQKKVTQICIFSNNHDFFLPYLFQVCLMGLVDQF